MRSLPEHPTTVFTKNCVSCYLPEVRSEMETVSNIVIMSKWEKNYSSFFFTLSPSCATDYHNSFLRYEK